LADYAQPPPRTLNHHRILSVSELVNFGDGSEKYEGFDAFSTPLMLRLSRQQELKTHLGQHWLECLMGIYLRSNVQSRLQ
jgi:hypothetical protein